MRRDVIIMTLLGTVGCAAPADVVLTGGRVWTGTGSEATAVAVRDGRIVAVGDDAAIERLAGSGTERVALDGRFVIPGLIDNHTHFIEAGFELAGVQLRDAATPAEFVRRIADHAKRMPDAWMTGGTWDHENWGGDLPDGRLPPVPLQFDATTGRPRSWPLRYTTAYWTATAAVPAPGRYFLRCRAVDANGIAQPLPRPLPKTGNNVIQKVELVVEA